MLLLGRFENIPFKYTGIVKWFNRQEYFKDGILHRESYPAIEWDNGSKSWWFKGKRHRTVGPAWEGSSGIKFWEILDKTIIKKSTIILVS